MVGTATRSARRAVRTIWWKACGLGVLMCALVIAAGMALRVRRRPPGVSVWEEARIRIVVAPGIRRLRSYLRTHAEFEEYCRRRASHGR